MALNSSDAAPGRPAEAGAARPYGPIGLVVSTLLILLAACLALLAIASVVFGAAVAITGWAGALRLIVTAKESLSASDAADQIGIVGGAVAYAVTTCCILVAARIRGGANWTALVGWRPWDMRRHARFIVLILIATLCWSLVASTAIEQVYPQAKDWVSTPDGTVWIIGFLALATLFAPITEELLFRGWIFTSLRRTIGARWGILATAILFALAHWESTHLYALAVFPVGLALGYVRERTNSVAASITFHALYNGVASVLLFVGK